MFTKTGQDFLIRIIARNKIALLYLILTLLSCRSGPIVQTPGESDIFQGFKTMNLPRADVPIGAIWVNGKGPDGPGLLAEDIDTTRSLSNYELNQNKSFQIKLDLSLKNFLKIDPTYASEHEVKINYKEIKIHTIKNLEELQLNQGQAYLFQAIKINNFEITIRDEDSLAVENFVKAKHLNYELSTTSDNSNRISVKGAKLFVAYNVVVFDSFTQEGIVNIPLSEWAKKDPDYLETHEYDLDGITKELTQQYEIKFDMKDVKNNCYGSETMFLFDTLKVDCTKALMKFSITDRSRFDNKRRPVITNYEAPFMKNQMTDFFIGDRKTLRGIEIDRLRLQKIRYNDTPWHKRLGRSSGQEFDTKFEISGNLILTRFKIDFNFNSEIYAPGW